MKLETRDIILNSTLVFLDEEGQSFVIDNNSYVFWFKNKTSVNLFNVKKIFLLSSEEKINIRCEDNQTKIQLINASTIPDINIDNKYILNKDINTCIEYVSTGYKLGEANQYLPLTQAYLHCIYFIANSDIPGIFEVNFNINNLKFNIGCAFDDKDESLSINLNNMGFNIPDNITSAINGTQPEEIFSDQNLLNNKIKELLFEYMHIIGNMGSYDSLINSLKWFGYGDNLKIYEFWKNANTNKYDLSDIEDKLYETLNYLIKYYQKTTYISLSYLLNNIKRDSNDNIIYETNNLYDDKMRWAEYIAPPGQNILNMPADTINWFNFEDNIPTHLPQNWAQWYKFTQGKNPGQLLNEPIPVLEDIIWNYTSYELYLKMSYLSKYFQKYFLPVHLDLYDIMATKFIFTTLKNIQYGKITLENTINSLNLDNISYIENNSKYFIDECTVFINQSNKWNAFVDRQVGYYGDIYKTKPGDNIKLFNENTVEYNIPLVFITSENDLELQKTDNIHGLEGFYILTDSGVKIPITYSYKNNNIYQKYELFIYFSSEYNVEWPKDWSSIIDTNFNRYKFEKIKIDNPFKPIDETLNIFVNRKGHYLFQSVFTDFYGTQTIINKEIDVYPANIDFDIYKFIPIKDISDNSYIKTFEGINYVSKVSTINKYNDNYIGYASGEPVKGSYTFDFLNKDYYTDQKYNTFDFNKYSSQLFFFTSNNKDAEKNSILMSNHMLFIKLNEQYGEKIKIDKNNYYIKYSPNTIFKDKDKLLKLNNNFIYSLNDIKGKFSDYIWTLKEGDKTWNTTNEWSTILVGLKKTFGQGFNTNEKIAENLNPNFEWYSQYRFILDLYTIEKINTTNQAVYPYTLIYLKPSIDNTYFATDFNNNNLPKWIIENESIIYDSNQEKYIKNIIKKKKRNNYIFSPYNEIYHYNSQPGYYSITLQCKLVENGVNVLKKQKNILKVLKKEDY